MSRRPSGATRVVGLIGWPVSHSHSPAMHQAAFESLSLDYAFVPFPVRPERLGQAVEGARALGLRGFSVTTPHKETIVPLLDELTDRAALLRAVNAVWADHDGRLHGDNTDGAGVVGHARRVGVDFAGKKALVLGAGGTARAVTAALFEAGSANVTVLNRTAGKAEALLEDLAPIRGDASGEAGRFPDDIGAASSDASVIVQCTSLGMGDSEALAWDEAVPFRADQALVELIYHPRRTAIMKQASREGARVLGGLGVLAHQGARAFFRWTGLEPPLEVMLRAIGALEEDG